MSVVACFNVFKRIAERKVLACVILFLFTLTLRLALLPWLGVPKPIIHDEFSYLLAADTYAHGRLANPPHQFWQHFESFQELQQPVYASKYQVLPGLTLALAQKLFHQPWAGVLLTASLLSAAICWMFQGWIAAEWAFLGAILFALRVGVLSYWMNSYEGGSVAAIGGALALGALPRIWKERAFLYSVTWAIGLAILMHSRPYDAAVLALSSGVVLAWMLLKSRVSIREVLSKIAVPAGGVLALSLAAVAYVDYRVGGDVRTLPYLAHDRQYEVASPILLVPLAPEPVYRHAVVRHFYTTQDPELRRISRAEPITQFFGKSGILSDFFFGFWPIVVPMLLWPFALRSTEERAAVIFSLVCLASVAVLICVFPHYAAAFAGVLYLRFLQSLSRLASWRKPVGAAFAAAIVTLFVLGFVNSSIGLIRGKDPIPRVAGRDGLSTGLAARMADFGTARDTLNRRLSEMPGKQLVMVRYASSHNDQNEWVFNSADIDSQKVVWAREMTPAQDRPFLDYFRDRQVWLLEPDQSPVRLVPYAGSQALGE